MDPITVAKWIKTDGAIECVSPRNGRAFELDELNKFVGGHFEVIRTAGNIDALLVVNEDGYMLRLPFNRVATKLLKETGRAGDIVGNCLLCLSTQIE